MQKEHKGSHSASRKAGGGELNSEQALVRKSPVRVHRLEVRGKVETVVNLKKKITSPGETQRAKTTNKRKKKRGYKRKRDLFFLSLNPGRKWVA